MGQAAAIAASTVDGAGAATGTGLATRTDTAAATGSATRMGSVGGSGPLAVVVASTLEERAQVLAQMSGNAPVLIVSSLGQAQALMTAVQDSATERAAHSEPGGEGRSGGEVRALHLHEDRRAVGFGTVEVSLTPLEFALLRLLSSEVGRVWRFDELVHRVWRTEHIGDVSQVHAVVKRLRAKLAKAHAPMVIEAVRGVGFRAARPRQKDLPGPFAQAQ